MPLTTLLLILFSLGVTASAQELIFSVQTDADGRHVTEVTDAKAGRVRNGAGGPMFLVISDKKAYLPGDEITLRFENVGSDMTDPFRVWINEEYYPSPGVPPTLQTGYPCDCGGANAGNFPKGMGRYEFRDLVRKRIPNFTFGRYRLTVSIERYAGLNSPPLPMSTTTIDVFCGQLTEGYGAPIVIKSMDRVVLNGVPMVRLIGKFPTGISLTTFVGTYPYYGSSFTAQATADGKSLYVPAVSGGGTSLGRVWVSGQVGTGVYYSSVSSEFVY